VYELRLCFFPSSLLAFHRPSFSPCIRSVLPVR
jgi:hypothetical protein